MASYGYTQPKYGSSVAAPKIKPVQPLVKAASVPTFQNPFGLPNAPTTPTIDGGLIAPQAQHPQAPAPTQHPQAPAPAAAPASPQAPQPRPGYDINTDPALQAISAYTTMNDEQIDADYEKQRRNALLAHGDEALVKKLLGDDSLAQAAGRNPTSTVATLKHQKDSSLEDLLTALTTGGHNLGNSGYRIKQEGEIGHGFENALAAAAAGLQGNLDSLSSARTAGHFQNAGARAQGLGSAYDRHRADILAGLTGDDGSTPDEGDVFGGSAYGGMEGSGVPDLDYLNALARAAATRRAVAV